MAAVEDGCGVGDAAELGASEGHPDGAELVEPSVGLDEPDGQVGLDGVVEPALDEVDPEPPPLGCVDVDVLGVGRAVVRVGLGVDVVRSGVGADLVGDCVERVAVGGPGLTGGSVGL